MSASQNFFNLSFFDFGDADFVELSHIESTFLRDNSTKSASQIQIQDETVFHFAMILLEKVWIWPTKGK